jgi:ATP phosphoribosyltransferase regulatory subunit
MAGVNRWILPDGVEEVLPDRARSVEYNRRRLLDLYHSWGYDLVIPPMLEFTDSLLSAAGQDLDLLTFRLTDQISGRMMGVRADITPQTARIDAHSLAMEGPTRLCYAGTVLHTRSRDPLSSRTPISIGVELFGEASVEADIEVISLFLKSLKVAAVGAVCLDLGHVDICRGLLNEAQLSEYQASQFSALLQRKAMGEIECWVDHNIVDKKLASWLLLLPHLIGGVEVLDRAERELVDAPAKVMAAIQQLRAVAVGIADEDVTLYFDLGEMPGYHYHTGLVFSAYVRGHGKALGNGGRYDYIGEVFGRARPATGFAFDLKALINLGSIDAKLGAGIYFTADNDAHLWDEVERLRDLGERVVQIFSGQLTNLQEINCDRKLVKGRAGWVVKHVF